MTNVLFALRKATTDSLSVVSATASGVSSAVDSLANIAEAGRTHSMVYLEKTRADAEASLRMARIEGEQNAKFRLAEKYLERQNRLSDKKFAAAYEEICKEWDKPVAPFSLAAE